MPRSRALWIAAMESLSSCGPHAKAQSPPPIAHAPKPMGVRCKSELPSCFLSILDSMRAERSWRQWKMKNWMARRAEKTDSSAALRNDKQKNRQRQKQKEQATTKAKTNA